MHIDEATGVDTHAGMTDLGPLAWVLDELRKSLADNVVSTDRETNGSS